jgi:hypothetical protein
VAEEPVAQDANLARVEATELPDSANPLVQLRFAHQKVPRTSPFVKVNCAAHDRQLAADAAVAALNRRSYLKRFPEAGHIKFSSSGWD